MPAPPSDMPRHLVLHACTSALKHHITPTLHLQISESLLQGEAERTRPASSSTEAMAADSSPPSEAVAAGTSPAERSLPADDFLVAHAQVDQQFTEEAERSPPTVAADTPAERTEDSTSSCGLPPLHLTLHLTSQGRQNIRWLTSVLEECQLEYYTMKNRWQPSTRQPTRRPTRQPTRQPTRRRRKDAPVQQRGRPPAVAEYELVRRFGLLKPK